MATSVGKLHVNEADIDVTLAGRLLAVQFPQWADLPIEPVHSAGTDNALYRLGDDMAIRLPRIPRAAAQVQLTSDKARPDAIRFYEDLGFVALRTKV